MTTRASLVMIPSSAPDATAGSFKYGYSMVVVTGATGHLGNVLVRELLSRYVPVRAVIPRGEDTTSLDGLKVEKVEGNVLDPDSLVRALQGAEVVYHLAGILFTSPRRTRLFYEVNLGWTRNVAEACFHH